MDVSPAKALPPTNLTATKPAAPVGNLWKFLVPVGIGIVPWFAPVPAGLETKAWHMFAVFVATIVGFMTAPLRVEGAEDQIASHLAAGFRVIGMAAEDFRYRSVIGSITPPARAVMLGMAGEIRSLVMASP